MALKFLGRLRNNCFTGDRNRRFTQTLDVIINASAYPVRNLPAAPRFFKVSQCSGENILLSGYLSQRIGMGHASRISQFNETVLFYIEGISHNSHTLFPFGLPDSFSGFTYRSECVVD